MKKGKKKKILVALAIIVVALFLLCIFFAEFFPGHPNSFCCGVSQSFFATIFGYGNACFDNTIGPIWPLEPEMVQCDETLEDGICPDFCADIGLIDADC